MDGPMVRSASRWCENDTGRECTAAERGKSVVKEDPSPLQSGVPTLRPAARHAAVAASLPSNRVLCNLIGSITRAVDRCAVSSLLLGHLWQRLSRMTWEWERDGQRKEQRNRERERERERDTGQYPAQGDRVTVLDVSVIMGYLWGWYCIHDRNTVISTFRVKPWNTNDHYAEPLIPNVFNRRNVSPLCSCGVPSPLLTKVKLSLYTRVVWKVRAKWERWYYWRISKLCLVSSIS